MTTRLPACLPTSLPAYIQGKEKGVGSWELQAACLLTDIRRTRRCGPGAGYRGVVLRALCVDDIKTREDPLPGTEMKSGGVKKGLK